MADRAGTSHSALAPADDEIRDYVVRHFWKLDELALAAGLAVPEAETTIAAGCVPGTIYAFDEDGWWSALGGYRSGKPGDPASGAERWYSPAAAWGLRHARLSLRRGATIESCAAQLSDRFHQEFDRALMVVPEATRAFPECFGADGRVIRETSASRARQEWEAWLRGGYAVCLRIFTGATCVAKEGLAASLRQHLADPEASPLDEPDILVMCERLAQLILPFAPWERPGCTPGLTIDRFLLGQSLGRDLPYRTPA